MGIVGIDEVGRGAWAGPLLVCGLFAPYLEVDGLTDSKQLSSQQRRKIAREVKIQADRIVFAWIKPTDIDRDGLSVSMIKACESIFSSFSKQKSTIVIDGNINYLKDKANTIAEVRADSRYPEVSAASIVAKVARDDYMAQMAIRYPGFGFETNVGYGTREHQEALAEKGVSDIHRRSFKPVEMVLNGPSRGR